MLKRLLILTTLIPVVCQAQELITIEEKTSNDRTHRVRQVFDNDSSLVVTVDHDILVQRLELKDPSDAKKTVDSLLALKKVLNNAQSALNALASRMAAGPLDAQSLNTAAAPIALAFTSLYLEVPGQDHTVADRAKELDPTGYAELQALVAQLRTEPIAAAAKALEYYQRYAANEMAIVRSSISPAELRILVLRENDPTRVVDSTFFGAVPPGYDALESLTNVTGSDPAKVADALAKQYLQAMTEKLSALKAELAQSLDSLEAVGRTDQKFQNFKKSVESIRDQVNTILNRYFGNRAADGRTLVRSFGPDINLLVSNIREAGTTWAALRDEFSGAAIQEKLDELTKFMGTVRDGVLILARNATDLVLSFAGIHIELAEIGRLVKEVPESGVLNVDNSELPDLASRDKLRVEVHAMRKTAEQMVIVGRRDIYSFKIGQRQDQLAFSLFTQTADESSWRLGLGTASIFKRASRGSHASNTISSIGLGFTAAAIDQDGDGSYEFGFAGTVTLLDDRILFGYGQNLTMNRPFVFVGFRLNVGALGF